MATSPESTVRKKLEVLVAESTRAFGELQQFLDDSGGCDHSVGVCWCEFKRMLNSLSDAIRDANLELNK